MKKAKIILMPGNVVKVNINKIKCDIFLTQAALPISDVELISLVRKYHEKARKIILQYR